MIALEDQIAVNLTGKVFVVTGARRSRTGSHCLLDRMHQIGGAMQSNNFDEAAEALARSRAMLKAMVPVLHASEPWSLFDRQIHDAHFAAVRRLYRSGTDPALAPRRRFDPD